MFELIKLLLDKIVGQISFDKIAKQKKDNKLATIGSELMLLFLSLNGVIVVGWKIVDVLKKISQSEDQEQTYSAHELRNLVRYQTEHGRPTSAFTRNA